MRTKRFYLLLYLVIISCAKGVQHSPRKPNVLFILVDDLGWKDLGCYGSSFYETPNIDLLASQSYRFTNAYSSNPVCSPTRASIMTGKHPSRIGITDWITSENPPSELWNKLRKNQKLIQPDMSDAHMGRPERKRRGPRDCTPSSNSSRPCKRLFMGRVHAKDTDRYGP